MRHDGALGGIAVATATTHADHLPAPANQVADGVEYVDQRIGRVSIVDDGSETLGRMQRLEAAISGMQLAQAHQHIIAVDAQQHRCGSNGCQVVGIEAAGEQHLHVTPIDLQAHAIDALLDQTAVEIGHRAQRIGVMLCLTVL